MEDAYIDFSSGLKGLNNKKLKLNKKKLTRDILKGKKSKLERIKLEKVMQKHCGTIK